MFSGSVKVSAFVQTGGQPDIRKFLVYKKLFHNGILDSLLNSKINLVLLVILQAIVYIRTFHLSEIFFRY